MNRKSMRTKRDQIISLCFTLDCGKVPCFPRWCVCVGVGGGMSRHACVALLSGTGGTSVDWESEGRGFRPGLYLLAVSPRMS